MPISNKISTKPQVGNIEFSINPSWKSVSGYAGWTNHTFHIISRCQQIHSVSIYVYQHSLYNDDLVQNCSYLSLVLSHWEETFSSYMFTNNLPLLYCFIVLSCLRHKLSNLILVIYWLATELVFLSCSVDTKSELGYWSIKSDNCFPLLVLALTCGTSI